MRKIHRSLIAIFLAGFTAWGCAQRDEQKMLEESSPESVTLEVSLGGSSRAERFLGTYDQIERLALDIVRNYGNKQVISDEELVYDDTSGKWTGTVEKLIVDFDYTITGHAYRLYNDPSDNWTTWQKYTHDNNSVFVEIFTGEVQHTVNEGINQLTLRMAPILDDRELRVPRITRIQRPFQLGVDDNASIEVRVDTVGDGSDDELSWRFRPVDNLSLPVTDGTRGTFSPDSGDISDNGSGYQDIISSYSAPSSGSICFTDEAITGQCPQKLQVRVSNLQEIGVTAHFIVYVTDNESASTTIDTNPVIESITAERVGLDQLQWTIYVSDDDLFDNLTVNWEYLFGDSRNFSDNSTDKLTDHSGRMQTVMEYEDSDDGMLIVTVCEKDQADWTTHGCAYQNEGSTSIEYELIPNAFHEIIICDDTGCELPNWFVGTMDNDKEWYACRPSDSNDKLGGIQTHDVLDQWGFTSKGFEYIQTGYSSDNASCSGSLDWKQRYDGRAEQAGSAVYPTTSVYDNATQDNLSVYQVLLSRFSAEMTLYDAAMISSFNAGQNCGYTANDWGDNVTLDIAGCDAVDGPPDNATHRMIIYYNRDNDTLRMGHQDNETETTYPDKLMCLVYGKDSAVFHPHVGNCNDGGGGSGNQTSGTYVTWTDPSDNATGLNASSIDNITVSFSQPMNSGSFWINYSGVCEGTFQLSSDNFSSCVMLNNWSGSGQTFSFTPAADLSYPNHYRIRVDNATSDNGDSVLYTSLEPGFEVSGGSSSSAPWIGTQQLGTSSDDRAYGVATDSSGNVYVTGYTEGGLDGNTSAGSGDLFVVKYSSSGTKQWTQQLGTSYEDRANGVATDSSGNVYVTGYTGGGLDGNNHSGNTDIFVVKYDSDGNKQ